MLLSIVSGTYNRYQSLQRMMSSVRRQMHPGIDYEFVIVDGGSTDNTLPFLRQQPDVQVIEHGELRGAIRAFCDGAQAATGQYVVMANDDIIFHDNSLLAAVVHLDETPRCGAVAFADNRMRETHEVMGHRSRDANGRSEVSPYAQVGMFRRWLGDLAGWWGSDDPIMQRARTYGGDNHLSAKIYEMGYTIDPVPRCKCDDNVEFDNMRIVNSEGGQQDSDLFYQRWPEGPRFGERDIQPEPDLENLRILYLPIYEGNHPQQRAGKRGLRNALKRMGTVLEYDYVTREKRNINVHKELVEINRSFMPHVFLSQYHGIDPAQDTWKIANIAQLRTDNPLMLCINWNGDYWPDQQLAPEMMNLLRWYDIALVVNDHVRSRYELEGIPSAYWQVASEQPTIYPEMPMHDVLFLGNAYNDGRKGFGEKLAALRDEGINVGIYGSGWGDHGNGETLYNYAASHSLMQGAKIVIGDNWFNDGSGFVSNRFFETLGAGAFLLHMPVDKLRKHTGFQAGIHYATFTGNGDLSESVNAWLQDDEKRQKIARKGHAYAQRKHSFDARVKQLFTEIIPEKMGAQRATV